MAEDNKKKASSLGDILKILQGGINSQSAGLGLATNALGAVSKLTTTANKTGNQTSLGIRDSISDLGIQSGIPMVQAISAATKVIDAIGDAAGFNLDNLNKESASAAGVSGGARFLNNAMQAIPGVGTILGAFSPNETIKAKSLSDYGEDITASYSGIQGDLVNAKDLSGKSTLFGIGRKKMNNFIDQVNDRTSIVNQLGYVNSLAKRSDYGTNIAQQNLNKYAGTNYQVHAVGKNGMKLISKEELRKIMEARKLQKGGVIGTDTSVLPEGALHARLNHLDEVNPELEDVTRKGIPVLDAEGNQVAEVECEELILRLEVTKKIEELMKDGSDEAMIEAGKLLVSEIIENTQDNTGQLTEEVENE